jgi:hypothetical protein
MHVYFFLAIHFFSLVKRINALSCVDFVVADEELQTLVFFLTHQEFNTPQSIMHIVYFVDADLETKA